MDNIGKLLERVQALEGHHVFKLRTDKSPKGTWYEGYILEVNNDHIVFSWAPSPFMMSDADWQKEHIIPFSWIDETSLVKNLKPIS
ncbi:MAG: hypothetical protein AAFQ63_20235 [Cyanobacteria bacterium J06621_11]